MSRYAVQYKAPPLTRLKWRLFGHKHAPKAKRPNRSHGLAVTLENGRRAYKALTEGGEIFEHTISEANQYIDHLNSGGRP